MKSKKGKAVLCKVQYMHIPSVLIYYKFVFFAAFNTAGSMGKYPATKQNRSCPLQVLDNSLLKRVYIILEIMSFLCGKFGCTAIYPQLLINNNEHLFMIIHT